MAVRLSGPELTKLQLALATLLSAFDFEFVDAWRKTTRVQIAALRHGDKSPSLLPLDGQHGFQTAITIPLDEYGMGPVALVVLTPAEPVTSLVHRLGRRYHLTPREVTVVELLAKGKGNGAVARQLGLSIHTVRRHVEHILMKLHVHSRAAIAAKLLERDEGTDG